VRRLILTSTFTRAWKHVPEEIRDRVDTTIQMLCVDQTNLSLDIRKLSGIHPPTWRLRIGDYRVVFRITPTDVTCLTIGHRKDVYRNL